VHTRDGAVRQTDLYGWVVLVDWSVDGVNGTFSTNGGIMPCNSMNLYSYGHGQTSW